MKTIKYISWFLGISMFLFGVLKFVDPFKGWYAVQISHTGLGAMAYFLGIAGEIATGLTMMVLLLVQKGISSRTFRLMMLVASLSVSIVMFVAIYVHLSPDVPAEVLPLKIKEPIIPMLFLVCAFINIGKTTQLK